MSYMALYRKFRPQEFDEVKGQDHIVTSLKNQVKAGRLGHAYLFTGTRGTGKTTVAKVFARVVNCQSPINGSPCNECAVCQHINQGTSLNVREIDAASNNGVESVREIISELEYPPTEGNYKVYIIDEVHMLSAGAFNAMLKTLEEPPSYVIFILATTELHKIPITILSRCQRYDFRRISIETITDRLRDLTQREGIKAEEQALRYVAKAGDGSMRDALSLLDQCIAFYLGEDLTYDKVLTVLGGLDNDVFSDLLRKILSRDVTGAIAALEEMVALGRDLQQFVVDFTWYMRNLLLVKDGVLVGDALEITTEQQAQLQEEAKLVENESLMRFIRIFSELANQIRYSNQKRVLIEIALIKLCRPQMEEDRDSLIDRVQAMEAQLEKGVAVIATSSHTPVLQPAGQNQAIVKHEIPEAVPEDVERICREWDKLYNTQDIFLKNALRKALVSVSPQGELVLVYDKPTDENKLMNYASYINKEGVLKELDALIIEQFGFTVNIKAMTNEEPIGKENIYEDAIVHFANKVNVDISEIEEEDY